MDTQVCHSLVSRCCLLSGQQVDRYLEASPRAKSDTKRREKHREQGPKRHESFGLARYIYDMNMFEHHDCMR